MNQRDTVHVWGAISMRSKQFLGFGILLAVCAAWPSAGIERFVSPTGGHIPPYVSWDAAATNIQDAIDVAADGDVIWVADGVYSSGGKVMEGDLTNRVALDKPLTVQSVNGPMATAIEGGFGSTGTSAIRCAWLTNGAVLSGFTLRGGATRSSPTAGLGSGGGVWCSSTNAIITNCTVTANRAGTYGGGVYRGTCNRCVISSNNAAGPGGGIYQGAANSSLIVFNTTGSSGGGAYGGIFNSCLISSNSTRSSVSGVSYAFLNGCALVGHASIASYYSTQVNCTITYNGSFAIQGGWLTNCIVVSNVLNSTSANFVNSCTTPLPTGPGNISVDPQLLADGYHLANTSPCRGAGLGPATGTDIDGTPWASPPPIGCDEWQAVPTLPPVPPTIGLSRYPYGIDFGVIAAGEEPLVFRWTHDGLPVENDGRHSSVDTPNLVIPWVNISDAGAYQVVVSNRFGMATSGVAQVVIHLVDGNGMGPVPPYLTWATAATNIQDAIDAAAPGDLVLVSDGTYAAGGKVVAGDLTNRIVIDKAIRVQSVNGPGATSILGNGPVPGPAAVRCAWLATNAWLTGFTVRAGATRDSGDQTTLQNGGGIWCASTNAIIANCVISSNAASYSGGGVYQGRLRNCSIRGNSANSPLYGGGTERSVLNNCTITGNAPYGVSNSKSLTNCIIYFNSTGNATYSFPYYCCITPASGAGSISADPQLLADGIHVASTSPCRGAGVQPVTAADCDNQPWASPASIGCDEWSPAPLIIQDPQTKFIPDPAGLSLNVVVGGQPPFDCRWTRDGFSIDDGEVYSSAHTTNLIVSTLMPLVAGDYRAVVSNAFGMATSGVARVTIRCVSAANANPAPPYATWDTAAPTIQEAIDAAHAGEIVLVTNGVYASGGSAQAGDLINRVTVNKPVFVASVNGPAFTIIQGARDPLATNGPLAVRCAWVTNGAALSGFTIQGGATRDSGDSTTQQNGGGVWGVSTNALVANCVISNNAANYGGGGCYGAQLNRCRILGNAARSIGGGVYNARAVNSLVTGNATPVVGGGACDGTLINTTVAGNLGGGVHGVGRIVVVNCIVRNNYARILNAGSEVNWSGSTSISSACTTPYAGPGNMAADPQLLDGVHIAVTSPCRQAGNPAYVTGTDIDGEPWAVTPSVGCDEVWEESLTGPIGVGLLASSWVLTEGHELLFFGSVTGRVSRVAWNYGDGSFLTNASPLNVWHAYTNAGDYTLTFTAYNADNPNGVSTNHVVHVVPLVLPTISVSPFLTPTFAVSFPGQPGVWYYLERSTNLTAGTPWQTVGSTFGWDTNWLQVSDTGATNPAGFYRLRTQ